MANIIVTLDHPIENGEEIKFLAPCDCTAVTGLMVNYPTELEVTESKTFVFKDAHGNDLTGVGNLFTQSAVVKVIVDVTGSAAYIQNADTNKYLESRLPKSVTVTLTKAGWSSKKQTVTVTGVLADEAAQVITPTPALASQTAYYEAGIKATAQAANSLTFTAEDTPSADLTVHIIIQGVSA